MADLRRRDAPDNDGTEAPKSPLPREGRWGVADAAVGLALSLGLAWAAGLAVSRGTFGAGESATAFSYLATWVPLLGTVVFASFVRGKRSLRLDFGLQFRWLDILYGLTLGFFLRSIATVIEIAYFGRPAGGGVTFGPVVYDVWWVLFPLLAPVLVAPIIEELFFRGLLQRAVLKTSRRSAPAASRLPTFIAVAVSSLVFAAVHTLQAGTGTQMAVVGWSTLLLGIGLGALAAITGRLGGAVIAHVVFNGLGVAGMLL